MGPDKDVTETWWQRHRSSFTQFFIAVGAALVSGSVANYFVTNKKEASNPPPVTNIRNQNTIVIAEQTGWEIFKHFREKTGDKDKEGTPTGK